LDTIDELGRHVEAAWKRADYDAGKFPDIARSALERYAPSRSFEIASFSRWLATAPIPRQRMESEFGEPQVRLFAGTGFHIEALFWVDGTTSVHRHGFSGAFQVLHGGSLHTQFTFAPRNASDDRRVVFGNLDLSATELLQRGDTRTILPGDGLIHSLFHLERPSTTLVVRTNSKLNIGPQYRYLSPGLAYDPHVRDERLSRLLEVFVALYRAGSPERQRAVGDFLEQAELYPSILALAELANTRNRDFEPLLAQVCRRHSEAAGSLTPAFVELRRRHLVIQRRHSVHQPPHRFLLALLLNLERRDHILHLVESRFPGTNPVDTVMTWIEEMSHITPTAKATSDLLGYRLGRVELGMLRSLLEMRSTEDILLALRNEYDGVDKREHHIRSLVRAMKTAALFKPLLHSKPDESNEEVVRFHVPIEDRNSDAADGDRDLVTNPALRWEKPSDVEWPPDHVQSGSTIWVTDPLSSVPVPYWVDDSRAEALRSFSPTTCAPEIDPALRRRLRTAGILVAPDRLRAQESESNQLQVFAAKEFALRGHALVPRLLPPAHVSAMQSYYRTLIEREQVLFGENRSYSTRRYWRHNEPIARLFLTSLTSVVARIVGLAVKPAYAYFASYRDGAVLNIHRDRIQCQYSISFLLEYQPVPDGVSPWPLWMTREPTAEGVALYQRVGDGIVYKGCELYHYRSELPDGHASTHIFFHYVPSDFTGPLD
jgi:hypothetical protein